VTREEFEAMLAEAALTANRRVQILSIRGAAPDHPVSIHCLESAYLKCYVCRVE
jgi:23S rRNA (cytosine1962-C5)-methyltransferase